MQAEVGDPTTIISNGDELARFSRWSSAGPRQEKRGMHTPKSGNPPDHANGAMSARGELPARLASGRYLQPDELALNQRVQLRACHVQLVGRMLHEQQCRNFMGAQHGLFHQGTQEAVRRRLAPQPVRPGQNGLRGLDRCVSNGPPRAQPRAGYRLCPACACCVEQCWQITSHPEDSCQVLARAFNKRNSLSAMYRSACAAILHS